MERPIAPIRFSDDEEFVTFFNQEWPRLLAYCRAAFDLSLPAAEDVAQESFLNVYRRWETISTPGAYLRTVATRLAIKRPPEEPRDDVTLLLAGGIPSDGGPESRQVVQQALRQLPSQQRAVFALHLDDYSDTDIAQVLGLTNATVRSYRRHARQTLARWHRQQLRELQRTEEGHR
jgi:DNA-directed RNA polymerase specialized sigma24 family protein